MVAEAANITAGTIYHYFVNKQDLFLAVHEEIQKGVLESLEKAIDPAAPFSEAAEAMLQVLLAMYIQHPNWIRFNSVVRTEARRNPELATAKRDNAWRDLFRRLTASGIASGEIDQSNLRATQAVLSAIVFGLNQHGIEASVTDHVECVRGFGLLLKGMLVTPKLAKARKSAPKPKA
jgi:AcrR family transcriptional regulator